MAFRFHKRIKLGKGFGVHVSKSGITPSYRGKRGSLSSKGYSIRTGIPGLTYRKTFSKAKKSGCLLVFILFLIGLYGVSCILAKDVQTGTGHFGKPTPVADGFLIETVNNLIIHDH
ncbi:DUF4236 domain-containing protein [Flagellimonas oceanensis]|uniref:DUF4236 domain-containing protein n=1 Tax=Flagellimonas oceanensis TaxID=2499163 RepID=UPI003BAA8096